MSADSLSAEELECEQETVAAVELLFLGVESHSFHLAPERHLDHLR